MFVRELRRGENAVCRNCGYNNIIPESAEDWGDEHFDESMLIYSEMANKVHDATKNPSGTAIGGSVPGERKSLFLSPAGAGITIICFFLPWARISCDIGPERNFSGADFGGVFWLVFLAALIIIGGFFYFKSQNTVEKSKPIIIISALVGLGVILIKYLHFVSGIKTEFGTIKPEDVGFTIQYGGIGAILGLILALIGVKNLENDEVRSATQDTSKHCPNCKNEFAAEAQATHCPDCGVPLKPGANPRYER